MVSKGLRPLAGPGRSPGLAFLDGLATNAGGVYSVMNEYNPVGQDGAKYCRPCGLVQSGLMATLYRSWG